MAKLERIYTVPLGDAYEAPRDKRAPRAVRLLRTFIARHMKARDMKIVLSEALNMHIWSSSIQRPPRRVKVRLIKEDDGVRAYLSDEKIEEPKKEEKKTEAKKEEPKAEKELAKPEKKAEPKKEGTPPEAKEEKNAAPPEKDRKEKK